MKNPIFIMGCPRSGTTMALNVIARHEDLAWISNYGNRVPTRPELSVLNRIYDLPRLGHHLYLEATQSGPALPKRIQKFLPAPNEPWGFWNRHLVNFQWERYGDIPPRRRTAQDITVHEIAASRKAASILCRAQGKRRLVSKYTDFPRMVYLTQAFPDARFIHIIRDGRAVAASYHKKMERGHFQTWDEREWWTQGWPEEWRTEWQGQYGCPLTFAAYQWKFFVREILKDVTEIPPEQVHEVRYRDIVHSPLETFNEILAFAGLGQSRNVAWYLDHISVANMNHKWRQDYPDSDQAKLNQIVCVPEFSQFLDE